MSSVFFAFLLTLFSTSFFIIHVQGQSGDSIRLKVTCTSDLQCTGTCSTSDSRYSAQLNFQATPEMALEYPKTQEGKRNVPREDDTLSTPSSSSSSLAFVCSYLYCCGITPHHEFYTNFDTTTYELKEAWAVTKSVLALRPPTTSTRQLSATGIHRNSDASLRGSFTGSQQQRQQQQHPRVQVSGSLPNGRLRANAQAPILPLNIQPVNAKESSPLLSPSTSPSSTSSSSSDSSLSSSSKKRSLLAQAEDVDSIGTSLTSNFKVSLVFSILIAISFMSLV